MSMLIFAIADKEYGLDISSVREVIRPRPITPVPDTADFVEGVISLHGKVVPLISLRKKLGIAAKAHEKTDRVIVARSAGHTVGVVVDRLIDVLASKQADIIAPDQVLNGASYLTGVAKIDRRIILIVDIDKLLSRDIGSNMGKIQGKVEIRKKEPSERAQNG